MFEGVITAIVTPFKNGRLDEEALRRHINFQIEGGVDGLLPCGTTGESPTLSHDEHKRVISITVDEAKGRVPVLAGAGSNSTAEAIDLATHARAVRADGLLLVTPYYNKPTQKGIYLHFKAVAEEVKLPVLLYNIPSRCGVNILPETLAQLARLPYIAGVKEATGDLNLMIRTIELCGPDFIVSGGDDGLCLPLWAVGGRGIISVASNVVPRAMADLWGAWKAGRTEEARNRFFRLLPLFKALFVETNPIVVKTALALMGRIEPELRLPMSEPEEATVNHLRQTLISLELLK